ncbi:hypothetical protein NSA19_07500 [Actinomyces bowdenii]|uniref:hypothetical protein n=1 Tax=Actinomyces bowdenii TaxID=131109 RepID=UPI00214BE42B|nr:hypothetical protein [Actinomyces bowdenii]MCR2052693.1 hypothetical protein [Actinomyces bowdenii]
MRWSLCAILATTVSACTPQEERTTASPSVRTEPVFLDEEVLCEAVSHQLLKDRLSFQVENYNYKHSTGTDKNGNLANSFNCNLYGQQSPPDERYGLLIGYAPGAKLRAGINNQDFSSLDDDGLAPVTFEGIEGRGYVWSQNQNTDLKGAWLYPDGHALEITLFPETEHDPPYDEADIEAMRQVLKELITTIPPIAAGPDRLTTFIPDPHDPQHTRRPTATPH